MIVVRSPPEGIGGFFLTDAVGDVADWTVGAVEDIAETLSDAGDVIGGVLKFAAPIVAFFPGIGTGLSVAMYAAGAAAAGDEITDAVLGTVSNMLPPGVMRISFDAGSTIVQEVIDGGDVLGAVERACRAAAESAGGERAAYAWDAGKALVQGKGVTEESIRLLRENFVQLGLIPLAAFDAVVSVGQGGDSADAAIAAGRAYLGTVGGPAALVAFDSGLALTQGKSLQEAGYVALQGLVKGMNAAERAPEFLRLMVESNELGQELEDLLIQELGIDVLRSGVKSGVDAIEPVAEVFQQIPDFLEVPAEQLARDWSMPEPVVRAAREIARAADGGARIRAGLRLTERLGGKRVTEVQAGPSAVQAARVSRDFTKVVSSVTMGPTAIQAARVQRPPVQIGPTAIQAARLTPAKSPVVAPSVRSDAASSPSLSPATAVALGGGAAVLGAGAIWWAFLRGD